MIITISAWIFLLIGLAIAYANASISVRYYLLKQRDRSYSLIPLIGGVMASFGMALSGFDWMRRLFLLPLLLDLGCLPAVLLYLWKLLTNRL